MTDVPASATMMKDGMARPTGRDMWGWFARGEVYMAIGVIGVILLLILPIPAFLMDVLLAVSLVSSVLILMTAVMMKKPLDFAIFPTVLLVSTLFRLGLNLASVIVDGNEAAHSRDTRDMRITPAEVIPAGDGFTFTVIYDGMLTSLASASHRLT